MNTLNLFVFQRLCATPSKRRIVIGSIFFTVVALLGLSSTARADEDRYWKWAVVQFGYDVVSDPAKKDTIWGETADPDHDEIPNLVEYAANTDPNSYTQLSDVCSYQPTAGPPQSSYPTLFAWQRTDDPDLRFICQKSSDLGGWLPALPYNFSQPMPVYSDIYATQTGAVRAGLRQMRYRDILPVGTRSAVFMRVVVIRRNVLATGPGIEPFSFTSHAGVPVSVTGAPSTVRSNTVTLGGFTGTLTVTIPAGVTLFVNGVAQTGTTATVKVGDALWMDAGAPAAAGVPRNYTLTIGGTSATWSFTTSSIAAVPVQGGIESGYSPVETGVSPTGAAIISMPIVVSPGTAGMQPHLALTYSSQGGNGPLGLGFSLGGLSVISRVGRTIAQDGVKGGVAFDSNDRFALDGQRLIAISGSDGAIGAAYRLEFDPTASIRSYGVEGSGPQRWTVQTKAGLTLSFGAQPSARIKPENGPSALAWAVDQITDTLGNSIQFTYADIARQRGEMAVSRITYTTNSARGLVARQQVLFEYEDRPDTRTSYVAGLAVTIQKRIHAIESRATNATGVMQRVRRYEMTYQQDALTSTSQLVSVQETRSDGSTSPATRFNWPASNASESFLKQGVATGISSAANTDGDFSTGDFDGDGRTDVLVWEAPGQPGRFTLYRSNGTGFDAPIPTSLAGDETTRSNPILLGDFNGDGKTDVLAWNQTSTQYQLYLSSGTDFPVAINTNIPTTDVSHPHWAADFNGDGRTDLLVWNYPGNTGKYTLLLSQGNGFAAAIATTIDMITGGENYCFIGQFNADGMADLMIWNPSAGHYDLYLATGTSTGFTVPVATAVPTIFDASGPNVLGDFNGDGLADLMVWDGAANPPGYSLFLCNGNGFSTPIATGVVGGQDGGGFHFQAYADFNGDGMADMITWNAPLANSLFNIQTSLGTTFTAASPTSVSVNHALNLVGDFNGDGKMDMLVWNTPGGGQLNLWLNEGPAPQMIQKVTTGHGGYTSFAYKALNDSTVYTKGTGLNYPCHDLQASLYVISSVTARNGIDGDPITGVGAGVPGENTTNYHYEGAWTCLDGRGFQGFKATETMDMASGIVNRAEYVVDPLRSGRPSHTEQRLSAAPAGGSVLISTTDTTWTVATTQRAGRPNTYFVSETGSVVRQYETNRSAATALVKTTTRTGITYDAYANLTHSLTDYGGGFTEQVTNTFNNNVQGGIWILGRLATSSVTKTAPNSPNATRNSSFGYDPATGLLTSEVIEPNDASQRLDKTYQRDGFGNILSSTVTAAGELPRTTQTTYTQDGRFVATTTNAVGHTESKTYDPLLGNVLTQTGPNGLTTKWEYDALGRPIRELRQDGTETRTAYRLAGAGAPPRAVHYVVVQSSGGAPRTVWYDIVNREIRTDGISFDGRTVSAHRVYDARGEVTSASEPYFLGDTPLYTSIQYDAVGRPIRQTAPGNRITKTTFNGLTTSITNPKLQTMTSIVNVMGWTFRTTDYAGKVLTKSYDPFGNLRFVTDSVGNRTEMRYDVRGNKIWMSEPNSGVSTFSYNAFGELRTQTDAKGQVTSLVHDRLGRVTRRTEPKPGGLAVSTFAYDTATKGIGQLASESGPGFVRTYYYDSLGRPAGTYEAHNTSVFAVSRSYDQYGRPDAITYPTGFSVRQSYTDTGWLESVKNGSSVGPDYWSALAVNARGQVTDETLGNGVYTGRTFDPQTGLVQSITGSYGAIGDVQKEDYQFDLIGNLTQRRDMRQGTPQTTPFQEDFTYDTLNRLKQVDTTGAISVVATYDDIGNLRQRNDVGVFGYAESGAGPHALTSVVNSPGGAYNKTCSYDANGNRISDGATTIDYSSGNQPVRINKGSAEMLQFEYTPGRQLYRQTQFHYGTGGITQSVRDYVAGLYEREITSEGVTRHIHYIAGGGGVIAIYTDERSAATAAQRLRYLHKDHLGSVDAITDNNGTVVERLSFDAWGRRRTVAYNAGNWQVTYPANATSAETHRGFTGHEMLDAVGLVHMNGRVYDPVTARFLSPDPFVQSPDDMQNLNRYSYVLNNPLSYTDPSGFGIWKKIKHFFGVVVKAVVETVVGAIVGTVASAIAFVVTGGNPYATYLAYKAGYGFGSAFSGTLLAGGSTADALRAGLRGAVFGIVEGIGHLGVESAFGGITGTKEAVVRPSIEHNLEFIAENPARTASHILVAAVAGGTESVVGGGKFANGALTQGFSYLLNGIVSGPEFEKSVSLSPVVGGVRASGVYRFGPIRANVDVLVPRIDVDINLQMSLSSGLKIDSWYVRASGVGSGSGNLGLGIFNLRGGFALASEISGGSQGGLSMQGVIDSLKANLRGQIDGQPGVAIGPFSVPIWSTLDVTDRAISTLRRW